MASFCNITYTMKNPTPNEFEKAAANERHGGILRDLWSFIWDNKKWWLLPIIVMLLIFGVLVVLSGSGFAPFVYTLF